MATTSDLGNWPNGTPNSEKRQALIHVVEISDSSEESDDDCATVLAPNVEVLDQIPSYHNDKKAKYCLPNETPAPGDTGHAYIEHDARESVPCTCFSFDNNSLFGHRLRNWHREDLMSERLPNAECIGLDLSRVPELRAHSSNVQFFQGNVTAQKPSEWLPNDSRTTKLPQDENLFDYVYSRLLILGMSDWPSFVEKEFSLLKTGGWAEIHDLSWDWCDATGNVVSDKWEWLRSLNADLEGPEKRLDVHCGAKAADWMRKAGFVDVQVFPYRLASCGETEESPEFGAMGKLNAESVPPMLHHAIEKALTDGQTVDPEVRRKIEELHAEMKATLVSGTGLYAQFFVTIGRKPE